MGRGSPEVPPTTGKPAGKPDVTGLAKFEGSTGRDEEEGRGNPESPLAGFTSLVGSTGREEEFPADRGDGTEGKPEKTRLIKLDGSCTGRFSPEGKDDTGRLEVTGWATVSGLGTAETGRAPPPTTGNWDGKLPACPTGRIGATRGNAEVGDLLPNGPGKAAPSNGNAGDLLGTRLPLCVTSSRKCSIALMRGMAGSAA